jgi:hypothetical protein
MEHLLIAVLLRETVRWQDASFADLVGGQTYCHLAGDLTPLPQAGIESDYKMLDGTPRIEDDAEP